MLHVVSLCSNLTNRTLFSYSLNICPGRRRLLLYSTLVHQLNENCPNCPSVIRVSGVKKSYLSEDLFTDGKRQIQRSRDIIFHDPGHTLVEK